MPPNIYIVGAQCTGKTTLVKALEKHLSSQEIDGVDRGQITPPTIITELARTIMRRHGYDRYDITSKPDRAFELQKLILQGQAEIETKLALDKAGWYISDRSGIDPLVYTKLYRGNDGIEELIKSEPWQLLKEKMRQSVVIVCEAGCDWLVDDEFRVMPKDGTDEWMQWHYAFLELLRSQRIDYHVIPASMKSIDDRVKAVLAFLSGFEEKRIPRMEK
ncbi:hypothetical protein EJ05DRAFT_476902 [Pseudovirgaria hyperparasitica]|uniref:NadR/Ttd14 AAA domain-containing protein n=1 Tax=Pseudovirgaria hyperparasitica TaxID=470096 RepID=A0A6A6W560_9PEZI|nr:uncharacterized protein EJ05DRAFT_476902 [Pseudovirgaria hyperparasitica]KAF2757685.1 hypothetical protein EJ05DRAFT_476902 [Pseudovirgaria hyperparasitica]